LSTIMTRPSHILAIDQGTTSTRAMVFDAGGAPRAQAQKELAQSFPRPGWVEHDPEEIWSAVVETSRAALAQARLSAADIAGIGITNQRETTILWERASGPDRAGDRLAGPPHGCLVRSPDRGRACGRSAGQDRSRHRSLFLGQQDRLAAR